MDPHGISWCAVALCQNPSLVPRMSMGLDGSFYQRQFQNLKNQQSWSLRIIHNDNPLKLKPGASLAALLSVPATFIVDLVPWCTCILCLFNYSVCAFLSPTSAPDFLITLITLWRYLSWNFVAFAQLLWGYDWACCSQQRCHQYQARPNGLTPKLKILACAEGLMRAHGWCKEGQIRALVSLELDVWEVQCHIDRTMITRDGDHWVINGLALRKCRSGQSL